MKEKILYIIAGANGSGKSTLANIFLQNEDLEFLNADDIAKEICPNNIESVKIKAGKIFIDRLNNIFKQGKSFAIETTLAGKNHIKTINKAKQLDYNIKLIYTFLDTPEICINRIKVRVLGGGHNVPHDDILRRFYRSKVNFWKIYKNIVDEWSLFYNGFTIYTLVAQKNNNQLTILNDSLYNDFMRDL